MRAISSLTLALMALTALVTLVTIRESMVIGRLTLPPTYDDVAFILDAARRMKDVYAPPHGSVLESLARGYASNPPKSLYTTPLAMVAFMVFGLKEWAPYVLHGIGLFVLLRLISSAIGKEIPTIGVVAACAAVALLPLGPLMVHEFRPDYMCALLIAWGVRRASTMSIGKWDTGRAIGIGLLFGGAALAKPHASPAAFGFLGLTLALCALSQFAEHRTAWRRLVGTTEHASDAIPSVAFAAWMAIRTSVRPIVLAAFAGVLFVLPHALLDGRAIAAYIMANMYGANVATWQAQAGGDGSARWAALYYISGDGGRFYFGPPVFVCMALLGAGVVIAWIKSRPAIQSVAELNRPPIWTFDLRREATITALTCAAGYTIAATAPVKHPVFGMPFYVLLLHGAAIGTRLVALWLCAFAREKAHLRAVRIALTAVLFLSALAAFRFPNIWGWSNNKRTTEIRDSYDKVLGEVTRVLGPHGGSVVVPFAGPIDASSLEWGALSKGVSSIHFVALHHKRSLDECLPFINSSDIVLWVPPNSPFVTNYLPVTVVLDPLLKYLTSTPRFERVTESTAVHSSDTPIQIFRRSKESNPR